VIAAILRPSLHPDRLHRDHLVKLSGRGCNRHLRAKLDFYGFETFGDAYYCPLGNGKVDVPAIFSLMAAGRLVVW
jgi:hypothetical protein